MKPKRVLNRPPRKVKLPAPGGLLRAAERDSVPRYLQIAAALRQRIGEGLWAIGRPIASVAELKEEFQAARVTVRHAIKILEDEGLLRSHQGSGTYVERLPVEDRWLRLSADWRGLVEPIEGHVLKRLPGAGPAAPRLGPGEGRPAAGYAYLKSLQYRGHEPFCLARVHVDSALHRRAPASFRTRVALAVLLKMLGADIGRARMGFRVGTADAGMRARLRLPLGAPTVEARCVVADRAGVVRYVGEFTYPADLVHFDVVLAGPPPQD